MRKIRYMREKRRKAQKKKIAAGLAVLLSAILTACGSTELSFREFSSKDKTVSMQLSADWQAEELSDMAEGWLAAGDREGMEALLLMQFPKETTENFDTLITEMEKGYHISDIDTGTITDLAAPELALYRSYTCRISAPELNGSAICVYGESDYAYYAIIYVADKLNNKRLDYFKACCSTFAEDAPETEISDAVRWFNAAAAVQTAMDGADYHIFGGAKINAANRQLQLQQLDEWWGVTDKSSAEKTMDWLLTKGHRSAFRKVMKDFEADGIADIPEKERAAYLYDSYDMTEAEAARYADFYSAYAEHGEAAIAAWDYSRAMTLFGWYYIAGYYTEEEAMKRALALAGTMQRTYDSWDSFMESYLLGYTYWAEEDSDERRSVYEELKAAPDGPYNVSWNMIF